MEKNDSTQDKEKNTMGKGLQETSSVIYWNKKKKHHVETKERQ